MEDSDANNSNPHLIWTRGSEWRKWDLHVHSPASNGFSGDWKQFIIQLGNADCDVIGINDYFTVAGYKEVRRRLDEPGAEHEGNKAYRDALLKLRDKTLFPVVECRMNNVLVGKAGQGSPRINFHLIFSNEMNISDIETFLRGLKVDGQSIGQRYEDEKFLQADVSVNFQEVIDVLNNDNTYRDRFLIWLPYDEYGGIDPIDPNTDKYFKQGLVRAADILGSSTKKQADFFLWRVDGKFSEDELRSWFGKRKPCIKGSDSHSSNDEIGKLKGSQNQPIDRHCWIKADPTFEGLCQIVNEPAERVFIGRTPPKLEEVQGYPTRFVRSVRIRKKEDSTLADDWFDCEIPLNHDMVAIIGDKGTGKSALADVIGLLGNTHCDPQYFSFLSKDRFCERNGRIAKQFIAELEWEDGQTTTLSLDDQADRNDVESLKYIPQSYLEKICTETTAGERSEFQVELRKVIFSHIEDHDRLGTGSLDELISYRSEELRTQIEKKRNDVRKINKDIVALETQVSEEYRSNLQNKLKEKERELVAHDEGKPEEVIKPQNVSDEQKNVMQGVEQKLESERSKLASVEAEITSRVSSREQMTTQGALVEKLRARLVHLKEYVDDFANENRTEFDSLGLDVDKVVKLEMREDLLAQKSVDTAARLEVLRAELDDDSAESLLQQKRLIESSIKDLKKTLDLPNQRYQEYVQHLKEWQERRDELVGSSTKTDTLEFLRAQIKECEELVPQKLAKARAERGEIARQIFQDIAGIRDLYDTLFSPVQELIEGGLLVKKGFNLSFSSNISDQGFKDSFLGRFVSQSVIGSFCGREQGARLLDTLLAECDFDDEAESIAFICEIERHLEFDLRTSKETKLSVASQLRKNVSMESLYDFLWSFEYLEPEYSLKLDGKELAQLSPGERGTLLLVFYLLVDKDLTPIVVDQPEENLDSKTVYRLLIPVIKEVKKRRQVIMVTHSPNIAVVCDAEQVIHASIDRSKNNRVIYEYGAIESRHMNKYLLDVLEGTRPAFENRESKYLPTS